MNFDQKLSGNMKSSQATLRIILGMEFTVPIIFNTNKMLSEKSLILTCSDESMKYQTTQYDHIIDHEGL